MTDPLASISVYLEPTKRKLTLDLSAGATIGDVVQGMVTHLSQTDGFDVGHFLREKIGDGQQAEWQLFRERENMQLLPPDARFAELQPPLEVDEFFTLKVNAKVAGSVTVIVHYDMGSKAGFVEIPWPGKLVDMLRVLGEQHGESEYRVYDVRGIRLQNPEQPVSGTVEYLVEQHPLADVADQR